MSELKAGRELDHIVAKRIFGKSHTSIGSQPPDYSTDIKAAWEVVEKMRGKTAFYFELREAGSAFSSDGSTERDTKWAARFVGSSGANFKIAETAPLAICLAALKAVES